MSMNTKNGKCFNCNSAYMNCFETCPNSPKERGLQNFVDNKPPKDESIKYVKLANPKLVHYENLSNGMPNYIMKHNIKAFVDNIADKTIYDAIIKYATEQGITDLFLIDEEFVKSALLNEIQRREKRV